jgi:hypothetical protein
MVGAMGCATSKESDTARTGMEQLLISSAVDQSLDKVNLAPIRGARVYLDTKYLDCVDKNYVIVSLHQRVLANGSTLAEKPEEADVILEVGSGSVGTDRQDLFVGIPQIPLPPPSPISVPRLAFMTRTKAMGTSKLRVVAYDVKSKLPVINGPYVLARSDSSQVTWLGMSPRNKGTVQNELLAQTGQNDNVINFPGSSKTAVASAPRTPPSGFGSILKR